MVKRIIKWITGDGQTYYSGYEENAEKLTRAWQKSHPENTYEVMEVNEQDSKENK